MKIQELRDKTDHELEQLVKTHREEIRAARFKASVKQLKNVHDIRVARRTVAQALTIAHQRKMNGAHSS